MFILQLRNIIDLLPCLSAGPVSVRAEVNVKCTTVEQPTASISITWHAHRTSLEKKLVNGYIYWGTVRANARAEFSLALTEKQCKAHWLETLQTVEYAAGDLSVLQCVVKTSQNIVGSHHLPSINDTGEKRSLWKKAPKKPSNSLVTLLASGKKHIRVSCSATRAKAAYFPRLRDLHPPPHLILRGSFYFLSFFLFYLWLSHAQSPARKI